MAERPSESIKSGGGRPQLTWEAFQGICQTLAVIGAKIKSCETHGFSYDAVNAAIMSQAALGDEEWSDLWRVSYETYKESLVLEARKRAVDGWNEPVFHQGKKIAEVNKKSERLLEVMLKAHVPEQFTPGVNVNAKIDSGPGLDVLKDLSLSARKQIRDIIVADLKAQKAAKDAKQKALEDGQSQDPAPGRGSDAEGEG